MATMWCGRLLVLLAACSSAPAPPPPRTVEVRLGPCAPVGANWLRARAPHPAGDARSSPLRPRLRELGRCFALASAPGTAIVELGRSSPIVRDASPEIAACVAAVPLRAPPVACSLAFGRFTAGELPGITIEGGAPLAPMRSADPAFAIRPAPQTAMRLVTRALADARAAGLEPVLAARRGTAWQLVAPTAIPFVPVPDQPDRRPALDVNVTENGVTLTGAGPRQEVGRDQLGQLPSRLVALRAGGDRIVEVRADEAVTYNRVVEVLDALGAAGFTTWSVR